MVSNHWKQTSQMSSCIAVAFMVFINVCGVVQISCFSPLITMVSASDETELWNATFHVRETHGVNGNTIIIGYAGNSSDGLDDYDLPEPPFPPQLPYLRSWLQTPFSVPYNNLLQEFKSPSSHNAIWNLSILWMSEPGNTSEAVIELSWGSNEIHASPYDSFRLYENGTEVANLLSTTSYVITGNRSIHHFKIIGQITDDFSPNIDFPIIPLFGIVVIIIIVSILTLFWYKRKK